MIDLDTGMTAYGWSITTMDGTGVYFSGDGGGADAALSAMSANAEDGEYLLVFLLRDAQGNSYTLSRSFVVRD